MSGQNAWLTMTSSTLRDVTPLFASFREAARHLWNTTFYRPEFIPEVDWDRRDSYSRVVTELFSAVVLAPLDAPDQALPPMWEHTPQPLARFIVQPNVSTDVPIDINRATPRTGYWDDPVNRIARGDARMNFVRFFDWDELGLRDFALVEVQVAEFPKYPALSGRYALLEFGYVQILFEEGTGSGV